MPEEKTVFTADVHFSGRVQGVGFRYATLQAAKEFAVTGEVANLADGRVHLAAQGEPGEVNAFLTELSDRMSPFIRETEKKTFQAAPAYKTFKITH